MIDHEQERIRNALDQAPPTLEPDQEERAEIENELPDSWSEEPFTTAWQQLEEELDQELHELALEPDQQERTEIEQEVPGSWTELRDELNAELQQRLDEDPRLYTELEIVEENFSDQLNAELQARLEADPELYRDIALTHDAQERAEIEQALPAEWLQELEREQEYQAELDEHIDLFATMEEKQLNQEIGEAITALEIDVQEITQEAQLEQENSRVQPEIDLDFDR